MHLVRKFKKNKKKQYDDSEGIKVHVAKQAVKCLVIFVGVMIKQNVINNKYWMKIYEGCPKITWTEHNI